MYGKGSPLLTAGQEVGALHMEIARANCLWPQSVEQGHLWPWWNTYYREKRENDI